MTVRTDGRDRDTLEDENGRQYDGGIETNESGVNRCGARGAAGGSSFECHARSSRPWSGAIKPYERGEGERERQNRAVAVGRGRSDGRSVERG